MGLTYQSESPLPSSDDLMFTLGALIYPKQMLRIVDPTYHRKKAKILRRDISDEWGKDGKKVIKVYHYLYRFSIDRLYTFREDKMIMILFRYYVEKCMLRRISDNPIMKKYFEAYIEASNLLLGQIKVQPA